MAHSTPASEEAALKQESVSLTIGNVAGQPATVKPRAACYFRVSTSQQETENQRPSVLQLVRARDYDVVRVFDEVGSVGKRRPVLDQLLLAAHRGEFEVLVVFAIDRLGRSMVGNLEAITKLAECGVRVVSVTEPWLTMDGPVRDLLIAVFSWVAEQERARLRERTRAGLERARAQGKRLGRPRVEVDVEKAIALLATGLSYRKVARTLGCGASTLHRVVGDHRLLDAATGADESSVPHD